MKCVKFTKKLKINCKYACQKAKKGVLLKLLM